MKISIKLLFLNLCILAICNTACKKAEVVATPEITHVVTITPSTLNVEKTLFTSYILTVKFDEATVDRKDILWSSSDDRIAKSK
jgi:uncharacterized protein YjdB